MAERHRKMQPRRNRLKERQAAALSQLRGENAERVAQIEPTCFKMEHERSITDGNKEAFFDRVAGAKKSSPTHRAQQEGQQRLIGVRASQMEDHRPPNCAFARTRHSGAA